MGAMISAEVEDDLYNGVERSTLTGVYSAEFTAEMEDPTQGPNSEEDSGSSSEDPSSYDESESDEYEDEYEDDEYDEEDYDDSDDFDDEESDLDDEFPEDDEPATSGNNGDVEGDDFDDEDDDFADEGEDEDPEPAPRRATKALAKRRTIKRSPRKAAK